MTNHRVRKVVVVVAVLVMIMAAEGCMFLPHPGHGAGHQGQPPSEVSETSPQRAQTTGDVDQGPPKPENHPSTPNIHHHSPPDFSSPWTWLTGAGMAAMMLLMVL